MLRKPPRKVSKHDHCSSSTPPPAERMTPPGNPHGWPGPPSPSCPGSHGSSAPLSEQITARFELISRRHSLAAAVVQMTVVTTTQNFLHLNTPTNFLPIVAKKAPAKKVVKKAAKKAAPKKTAKKAAKKGTKKAAKKK